MPVINWLENELARFLPLGDSQADGNTTVRRVLVPFDYQYIDDLKAALLGWTEEDEDDGSLLRYLPYKDPDNERQFCIRVAHQGYGYGGDRILSSTEDDIPFTTAVTAKFWLLTLYFSTLPYEVGDIEEVDGDPPIIYSTIPTTETERFAIKEVNPGREYINPPQGGFKFEGVTTEIPIPIPTIIPYSELDTTWFQIPLSAYPVRAIDDCLGKVNVADFIMPAIPDGKTVYPAETVHLLAVKSVPRFDAYGGRTVDIIYHLRYRPSTWNKFPNSNGSFTRIVRKGDTSKGLFEKTDFNNLFKSDFQFIPYP